MTSTIGDSSGRQHRAWPTRAAIAAVVLIAAAALAACSTSSSPGGSAGGQPTDASSYQDNLAYAECMRTHGVADFPDPESNGGFLTQNQYRNGTLVGTTINGVTVDASSPQYVAANGACKHLKPGPLTAAQLAQRMPQALKFSACMRAHGIADFPDPTVTDGKINISLNGATMDPSSPQFQAAMRVCQPFFIGSK
jgi:hypothetical protein